ncbi:MULTISPECIES: hypothetical protein [Bradyrhizobium]|uniref:hypothetical protein n=2 Tax=Nitrobacteraceae TaxID=41294 RepID=UPI0005761CD4|nr:hypothetical protein [Bradyrhizobium sp. CCBAU 15544]MDA9454349.1 hypothetical protein [Bradyrhizobium sp. CCBAU 21359]
MGFSLGWKYGAIVAAILWRVIGGRRSSFMNSSRRASGSGAAKSFPIIVGGRKLQALMDDRLDGVGKDTFGRAAFGNDGFGKEGVGFVDDRFGNDRFRNDRFGTRSSRQRVSCCCCPLLVGLNFRGCKSF